MFIISNVLGALWFALGFLVFGVYCWVGEMLGSTGLEVAGVLFGSAATTALDLVYRWVNHPEERWKRWIEPRMGGHIFFFPMWLFGGLGVVLGARMLIRFYFS